MGDKRVVVTAAEIEPVSLDQVKTHCRITTADDDEYILGLIRAAREYVEQITNRTLITSTWDYYLNRFPYSSYMPLTVPAPPLQSITSIQYTTQAGTLTTWDSAEYDVDTDDPVYGLVYPAYTYTYPSDVRDHPKAVVIRYVAGYEDSAASPIDLADSVPDTIKQAIYILVSHMYENREPVISGMIISTVPKSFDSLLASNRIYSF